MKTATRTALASAVIVIAACSSGGGPGTQPPDPTGALRVTPGVDTVLVGDTVRFATLRDSAPATPGDSGPVSWTVSDSRVAVLEVQAGASALVRALHQGTTTVTAAKAARTASGVLVVEPWSKLVFTGQPSNATAGVVLTPAVAVTIEDSSGQPLTSATNTVTVVLDTGVPGLSGTNAVTVVNGVATFRNLSIQKAGGGYTLRASSGGFLRTTSAPFAITPAAPAQLAFVVQPSATDTAQLITPAVQVAIEDAFANAVPSATNAVTIAIGTNPGGGTLAGTTAANAVSGVVTFATLGINRPGSAYTLVASAPGLVGATSVAFNINKAPLTFAAVSAGSFHTCGLTLAREAYCWGNNTDGELGNGSTTNSTALVAVSGGLTFAAVSAGRAWTCGLTPAGTAYCWGYNTDGELGNGTTANSTAPVAVSGGLTFAALSAGGDHTCGLTPAGTAYCWGYNAWGQLGNPTTQTCPSAPLPNLCSTTPVAVSGGLTFAALSAGDGHTCGLTPAGAVYCWGYNTDGRLGNGTTTNSTTPVAVSGGLSFAAVSAGQDHACGLTPAGAAYCWGSNTYGWLGNGTTTNSTTPVAVAGRLTFAAISAGGPHACGITTAGAAYCWGYDAFGALGDGTFNNSTTPVAVAGGLTFAAVSAGGFHTCAVTRAGAGYCWGSNGSGELGYATPLKLTCYQPRFGQRRCWWASTPSATPGAVSDPAARTAATRAGLVTPPAAARPRAVADSSNARWRDEGENGKSGNTNRSSKHEGLGKGDARGSQRG